MKPEVFTGFVLEVGEEECRNEDCPARHPYLCEMPAQRWTSKGWEPPLVDVEGRLLELKGKRVRVTIEEVLPWGHLVGVKNEKGQALTVEQLRAWIDDPNRKLECVFCARTLPLDAQFCPTCREYKGIQPHIPGWSEGE